MAGGMSSLRLPQNRKWRIAIFFGVLCIMAWIVWRVTDDEPRYQGRSLWHWYELSNSTNKVEEAIGEEAIRSMGTNAVPYLINVLERGPSELNSWIAWASYKTSGKLPRWQPVHDHEDAAFVLEIIGTNAVAAVPALIESMQHRYHGTSAPAQASIAIVEIGFQALPFVVAAALTNSNENISGNASRSLQYFFWYSNTPDKCFAVLLDALLESPLHAVPEHIAHAMKAADTSYSISVTSGKFRSCGANSFPKLTEVLLHCRNNNKQLVIQDLHKLRPDLSAEQQSLIDTAIRQLNLETSTNTPSNPK